MTIIVRLLFTWLSCLLKLSYMSSYNTFFYIIQLFLLNIKKKSITALYFLWFRGWREGIKAHQPASPCVACLCIRRSTSKMVVLWVKISVICSIQRDNFFLPFCFKMLFLSSVLSFLVEIHRIFEDQFLMRLLWILRVKGFKLNHSWL